MSSQTPAAIPSVISDDGNSSGGDAPTRSDPDKWYFSKERLENTPSRKYGIDADKELTYRQQAANYIQDIGQKLQVNQLCINTAIVYMHRFYMFHSFTHFHRNPISAASIFLAAKVEEQPRKLEHVIKVAHYCLNRENHVQMDIKSEKYLEQSAELVMNENILLQTLGFDVAIDHPHTHVVKCCQLVRASKDLAQTSYFMATNSLHLTTMCLQYKPTVVACVCIHLACKWSSWEIPRSKEGKDWFWYVDDSVTSELLEKLTTEFLAIFNKSPSRLKRKINSLNNAATSSGLSLTNSGYPGFDSSPGQNHNQSRSRSPSPKRQGSQKSSSSQPGPPVKPKPHGMPMPHHPMKLPYPPGAPGSASNKHPSHPHPPPGHFSSHSSAKPHPGMSSSSNVKDPHHPHHPQHSKNPYPPHGHGQHPPHGQYPHVSRSGMQSSGSSQPHHGLGGHSKPHLPPGSSSSSSHPYSSSQSMKNMQSHNPSKPPHMPPGGSSKIPPNQVPGAVKNPSQPMFHSSQPHLKKPYDQARPEFGIKRDGTNPSGSHHPPNHARPHEKHGDGRHHPANSNLPPSHGSSQGSGESRGSSHHGMFMNSEMDRSAGGNTSSNPKMPYMDARSVDNNADMSRHRNSMQQPDAKRGMPHGASGATNGNNTADSISSLGTAGGNASGASDSHVPSKNSFRQPPPLPGSTYGQNSQSETGANKVHADGFGGEYGSSYGSSATVLSIEDRRKRRHEAMALSNSSLSTSGNTKRPRMENYINPVPISTSSLFSPEESPISDSTKRLPPSSQFSPTAIEGNQTSYSKLPERSHHLGSIGNSFSGSSEGIVFGSSADIKPDMRRLNPSVEFQAPDLLQPISDVTIKVEPPLSTSNSGSNNAPRAASLFSPEFTPSNSIPPNVNISPPPSSTDMVKRDVFSNMKQEVSEINQQSSSGYSESGSHVSFTGRLSNSPPKREDVKDGDDSHSGKKSKKKEKKHKHKHKEDKDKRHKKDKHKDKEKEKDKEKKEKHRSKDKEKHGSGTTPSEVSNDLSNTTKLKIKIGSGRDESKSSHQSSGRHSSSKSNSSSSSSAANHSAHAPSPVPNLKVKISSKNRVSSLDDDVKHGVDDESTPCCPGFGPCTTCNRDTTQDHYRFFASSAPTHGLTMKIAKSKEASKSSSKDSSSSSSRESKKSKDKTSKTSSSSSASSTSFSNPLVMSSSRPPPMSGNHVHKNGMEKPSKKKDKSMSIL